MSRRNADDGDGVAMKTLAMARLLLKRPLEVCDRLEAGVDSRLERLWKKVPNYETSDFPAVRDSLRQRFGLAIEEFYTESALTRIEDAVKSGLIHLADETSSSCAMNGDFAVARLCYALCRALRPLRIVETGVCHGVTTAFVLQALTQNNRGTLFSIDLPPLGNAGDDFVGALVPQNLRSRWVLRRGTSRALLSGLLSELGRIDFFLHDSLHTYRNMRREFAAITPYLSQTAVVLSDDIERNDAFDEWVSRVRPSYWAVLAQQEKPSLVGMAVFSAVPSDSHSSPAGMVVIQ